MVVLLMTQYKPNVRLERPLQTTWKSTTRRLLQDVDQLTQGVGARGTA